MQHGCWNRSDQLELLEDKLREYSALGKQQYEDKVGRLHCDLA